MYENVRNCEKPTFFFRSTMNLNLTFLRKFYWALNSYISYLSGKYRKKNSDHD